MRRLWRWLTYWQVPCDGCAGTGLCTAPNQAQPHSCCGDCDRRIIRADLVPENFMGITQGPEGPTAMIGTGVMWRRPWSRRQVRLPR